MPELSELIREYSGLLVQQSRLSERKERIRDAIAAEMATRNLNSTSTDHGRVARTARFKLFPRQEPVLGLLTSEDLLYFASFTPARVNEFLVPKYGRESLVPLFDVQRTERLVITSPPEAFTQKEVLSNGRPVKQRRDELASVPL
jgi:hypothetical protein